MLAVPGVTTVRGYSFFGDSFLYVIFEDGTDIYWARARVLEYLNQAASDLPANSPACLIPRSYDPPNGPLVTPIRLLR